ncbi:TetR/AcrR family transcriptional regulator [Rhodococcus sp. 06-156-3C]|nr:TetR/AcrR family transcriptional regulator [Rhodococcus sp. 06-156-3]OZD18369.1 TetR/AcrR family transcriptional regulator [Rhodococcus sp. 06-156-4C]OZD18966.1 TetR/AcrR family transcriptional regulator [Rhodococcus sp. 06-156-3C]OZD22479.1 TetR/AcrR family transcriptional regulator [Rhodococcus sp. 06-156-4a]OZD34150.1 TetR/AcrR family transcriptional regulator [Rhodococcus sp. 06-156-3b]OZF57347.1 TetR/AcrR family transcriptional regulator [Rhodococcus sp. 06-156-4]
MERERSNVRSRTDRRWARTTEVRETLLAAALTVFLERGYSEASIADIVQRSGSSVGSVYHHFGGKPEMFVALWQGYETSATAAAGDAVAEARRSGQAGPTDLFLIGARAYLEFSWSRHEEAQLFSSGDAPPGFDLVSGRDGREWIRQNSILLDADASETKERITVAILTAVIDAGAREVSLLESRDEAFESIDVTLGFVRRAMT